MNIKNPGTNRIQRLVFEVIDTSNDHWLHVDDIKEEIEACFENPVDLKKLVFEIMEQERPHKIWRWNKRFDHLPYLIVSSVLDLDKIGALKAIYDHNNKVVAGRIQ